MATLGSTAEEQRQTDVLIPGVTTAYLLLPSVPVITSPLIFVPTIRAPSVPSPACTHTNFLAKKGLSLLAGSFWSFCLKVFLFWMSSNLFETHWCCCWRLYGIFVLLFLRNKGRSVYKLIKKEHVTLVKCLFFARYTYIPSYPHS